MRRLTVDFRIYVIWLMYTVLQEHNVLSLVLITRFVSFSQRGREGRMIRLLSDTKNLTKGTSYGFGVDEDTALVITHADTNKITGKASYGFYAVFFCCNA